MTLPRTYEEAEAFLLGFVNYEAARRWPSYDTTNFDLERFARLLDALGAPHRRPGLVHVAGTKGKGSTSALLASILTASGRRTGLFTSPHLVSFRERIQIDGAPIGDDDFARLTGEIAARAGAAPDPGAHNYRTTFEILTAMAFRHFADAGCGAAVFEVGLGGRLDSTNVLQPEVAVITALGLDHQHILGGTLAAIAREKGGIIKPGVPCVVAPQTEASAREAVPVLEAIAAERGAPLIHAADAGALEFLERTEAGARLRWRSRRIAGRALELDLPLLGRHQARNLHGALAAAETLELAGWRLGGEAIARGVAAARVPARCEVISRRPVIVLDAAHCPLSIGATVEAVEAQWPDRRRVVCFSCLSDKNAREMLRALAELRGRRATILFPAPSPRAAAIEDVLRLAAEAGIEARAAGSPAEAVDVALALAAPEDVIVITGSFYSVAPARQACRASICATDM